MENGESSAVWRHRLNVAGFPLFFFFGLIIGILVCVGGSIIRLCIL